MRNMSFSMTTPQVRDQLKDVTRRNGWWWLAVGEYVQPVEKGMGLKLGEKVVRINGPIFIIAAHAEPLRRMTIDLAYGIEECRREGFPQLTPAEFVAMYCAANRCTPDTLVNRIAFRYATPLPQFHTYI